MSETANRTVESPVRDHTAVMAEYVDRLVTVEMRNRGMPAGKITPLYEAARAEGGGLPLTYRAAKGLAEAVGRHDTVLVVTGAGSGPLIPNGENDGPVGAAVLAHALQFGLGAVPVMICETQHAAPIVGACEAAGITIRDLDTARGAHIGGAVLTAPTVQEEVETWADDLLERLHPAAIVAIERLGPNRAGIVHGSTGLADWDPLIDLASLFTSAARRGIFSVGIGDAGNEIGFGRIAETVRQVQPQGAVCQCPCGAGMATVVPTDVLVVAAVSNWGAYGIEACLSMLLGRPDLPHTAAEEERIITHCLDSGGLEAIHCTRRFAVDGIAGEVSVSLVQMLGEMVRIHAQPADTGVIH